MKKLTLAFAVIFTLALAGCEEQSPRPVPADVQQRQQQEQISQQGNAVVGMPAITRFAEKKMMRDILEMRDKMVPTTTYTLDMNGKLHKLCDSLGFGLPGATQYTNPAKIDWRGDSTHGYASGVIPQADPNGLFSPSSDEGTYVMCKDPHSDKIAPVRMEPRTIISPFPLD